MDFIWSPPPQFKKKKKKHDGAVLFSKYSSKINKICKCSIIIESVTVSIGFQCIPFLFLQQDIFLGKS